MALRERADPWPAIWDNRSTYHTANYDYDGHSLRTGQHCVGIGERPFLDPSSTSKRKGRSTWSLAQVSRPIRSFKAVALLFKRLLVMERMPIRRFVWMKNSNVAHEESWIDTAYRIMYRQLFEQLKGEMRITTLMELGWRLIEFIAETGEHI